MVALSILPAESAYDSVRLFAVSRLVSWLSAAMQNVDGYSVDII